MNRKELKKYENILIMGCDVLAEISEVENPTEKQKCMRSDAMIVVSINRKTGKIRMVTLERDVLVGVHGYGYVKLNAPVVYGGPKLAIKVINDYFRLNIKKYIMMNISNMIEFVDSVGGIDIELTDEEAQYIDEWIPNVRIISKRNDDVPPLVTGGMHHLNGMQTVAHARNRTVGSGLTRKNRINNVMKILADKFRNELTYTQIVGVGIRFMKYIKTNIGLIEGLKLLRIGMKADIKNIETYHVPEEGTCETKRAEMEYVDVDFEKATGKMWDFLRGDRP